MPPLIHIELQRGLILIIRIVNKIGSAGLLLLCFKIFSFADITAVDFLSGLGQLLFVFALGARIIIKIYSLMQTYFYHLWNKIF